MFDLLSSRSRKIIQNEYGDLIHSIRKVNKTSEIKLVDSVFSNLIESICGEKGNKDIRTLDSIIQISKITVNEIGLGISSVCSIFLLECLIRKTISLDEITKKYGKVIRMITEGLYKISNIEAGQKTSNAENLRKLLLNLAEDLRVILIRLAQQLYLMRSLNDMNHELQVKTASETSFLYAPLAHRLGLYIIKSELEDLSLKYRDRKTYNEIARKLSETMKTRQQFIQDFIHPIKEILKKENLKFEIIGRPKSIFSIWNKMQRKGVEFEDIYDLFAIRIIIDSVPEQEKADCWKVYSLVSNVYQPNPLRLRDWISVPKSNGYESLHTTVIGQDGKWVEIQIRTQRMNEIAEKGFAAHWKYKGGEDDRGMDNWLSKVREILETPQVDANEFIDDFKLSLYNKEIFVFTPKGDLKKFPAKATVLDFAYDIHSDIGSTCIGAKVNGKNVPIRHVLQNGDRIEIISSKNQKPKQDWLSFVITSKAKSKIRQKLNEDKYREAENGKELIKRRFKNWKIEYNDDTMRKVLRHYKYNNSQDFYYDVSLEKIDLSGLKEFLTETDKQQDEVSVNNIYEKVEKKESVEVFSSGHDFLIIDDKVSNVAYKLSKCCNPIFGDEIFGFVTVAEGIKIHRINCPNAAQMISKYGYRIIKAHWNKSDGITSFPAEIVISGENVPGILNNISEIIEKDLKVALRSIALETEDGTINGRLKVMVLDIKHLDYLIARLSKIKGVFSIKRRDTFND